MNKQEHNKYSMFRDVNAVFTTYYAIVESVPKLLAVVKAFCNGIALLEKTDDKYKNIAKGMTEQKKKAKAELIGETKSICGALYVLGQEIGDMPLCAISGISESDLIRMRDNALMQKCKNVAENLALHRDQLVEFGITTLQADEYFAKVNLFDTVLNKKGNKKTESVTSRDSLKKYFSVLETMLNDNLDKLMEQMKKKDIDFYNTYQQARSIKDLGVRHRKPDEPVVPVAKVAS